MLTMRAVLERCTGCMQATAEACTLSEGGNPGLGQNLCQVRTRALAAHVPEVAQKTVPFVPWCKAGRNASWCIMRLYVRAHPAVSCVSWRDQVVSDTVYFIGFIQYYCDG